MTNEEAIEICRNIMPHRGTPVFEALDLAIKALEQTRWIPYTERLPEENQRVLVIYRPLISDTEKIDIDFIKGKYWQNHGGVIAWMLLPEWEGMEYDEERNTMKIKKSAYDDAVERIEKSTFTLHDGLDCVETLVALEAVMIASAQTQPCEDCVSRKLLSDNICEGISCNECSFNEIDGESGCLLQKRFDELPSVTPKAEQKWIPCEERLPEEGGDYLVTTKWEGSYSGDTYIETNMAVYREKLEEWDCKDVIAWMPLPEPYEKEAEA